MSTLAPPVRPAKARSPRHGTCKLRVFINSDEYILKRQPAPARGARCWHLKKLTGVRAGAVYAVTRTGGLTSCTCPDHRNNKFSCKHIKAIVALGVISGRTRPAPPPPAPPRPPSPPAPRSSAPRPPARKGVPCERLPLRALRERRRPARATLPVLRPVPPPLRALPGGWPAARRGARRVAPARGTRPGEGPGRVRLPVMCV